MQWDAPAFVVIKMDAEINSYQDEFNDIPDVEERSEEALVSTNPTSKA